MAVLKWKFVVPDNVVQTIEVTKQYLNSLLAVGKIVRLVRVRTSLGVWVVKGSKISKR